MKAIILSAGQGSRLLPRTENLPKCLLPLASGYTALSWQLDQLARAGITEAVVVTGFLHTKVQDAVSQFSFPHLKVHTLFNPFYKVADNLGSVWLAKDELHGDCILLNGDTMFTAEVVSTLIHSEPSPITVTISHKEKYDDDDMKVSLEGNRLVAIGKTIPLAQTQAESIGMIRFTGTGAQQFVQVVEKEMQAETSLKRYYLHIIHTLAQESPIHTASVTSDQWCEIDTPADLEAAHTATTRWLDQDSALRSAF